MTEYERVQFGDECYVQFVYDDDHNPRDRYPGGADEETREYEEREIKALDDGSLVALGARVFMRRKPCEHCGRGPDWEETDSLWSIVVGQDEDLRKLAIEYFAVPEV